MMARTGKRTATRYVRRYPFFEFIMKSEADRGHARSMALSLRETVRSKYWLHLEDDFQFFEAAPADRRSLRNILRKMTTWRRSCSIAATRRTLGIRNVVDSGELRILPDGMRYWCAITSRHGEPAKPGHRNLRKWPHFSFRPSLMRTEKIHWAVFDESPIHFELDFAERYTAHGYRSALLDTICCTSHWTTAWKGATLG